MNTIDKRSAELFIKDADELRDGMTAFFNQSEYVIDTCVHCGATANERGIVVDFNIYVIEVYKRHTMNDAMNFSCMTKSNNVFYEDYNCIDTYYFDSASNAHLAFAELAAKLNHF